MYYSVIRIIVNYFCSFLLQLLSLLERAKAGAKSVGDNPVPYFTMNMPSANDGGVLPLQEKNNQAPSNVKAPEVKAHGELLDLSSLPTLGKQPLSGQKASPSPQLDDKSLDELLQDISELADEAPKDAPSLGVTSRRKEADDFHSDFEDDPVAEKEGEDLNRAPVDVVQKRKKEMEVLFEANRVRPGDEGWEYDKEVDFGEGEGDNKLSCGWDDESEVDSDPEF